MKKYITGHNVAKIIKFLSRTGLMSVKKRAWPPNYIYFLVQITSKNKGLQSIFMLK